MFTGAGRPCLGIDPLDGTLWLTGANDPLLVKLTRNDDATLGAETFTVHSDFGGDVFAGFSAGANTQPVQSGALAVDGRGHVFLSVNDELIELDRDGNRLEKSRFDGMQGGQAFQISRSFTNVTEAYRGPSW